VFKNKNILKLIEEYSQIFSDFLETFFENFDFSDFL